MERIAVYGKGGIGKSVIATNLSASFALSGKRVLHIGCEPKHDSAVRLMDSESPPRTVLEVLGEKPASVSFGDIISTARLGIECCESGGPLPGVGCAGRGVARTLEFLEELDLFARRKYDAVMFDVLGDVVCGGFAAPLRAGFAQKVFIVTSEEPMSLYAANNICQAVRTYGSNGVVLGGLIGNLRDNSADREALEMFATIINTRLLAVIERDDQIIRSEREGKTLVELAPETETARTFERLSGEILALNPESLEPPDPMSETEFFRFIKE
jgi:nitrogenase iron protein NifH